MSRTFVVLEAEAGQALRNDAEDTRKLALTGGTLSDGTPVVKPVVQMHAEALDAAENAADEVRLSLDNEGVITRLLAGADAVAGYTVALAATKASAVGHLAAGDYAGTNYVVVTEDEGYATGSYPRGTAQLYQVTSSGTVLTRLGPAQEGWNAVRLESRETFAVNDEPAPLASPRAAAPGPGVWTVTDPDQALSVQGTALVSVGGKGSTDYNRTRYQTALRTLGAGDVIAVRARLSGAAMRVYTGFALNGTTVDSLYSTLVLGGKIYIANEEFTTDNAFATPRDVITVLTTTHRYRIVEIAARTYALLDVVQFAAPLVTPVAPALMIANNFAARVEEVDVFRLRGPWVEPYGVATSRREGSQAEGVTWSHEPDSLHHFVVTTLPSTGFAEVAIRRQDNDNKTLIRIAPNGSATVVEVEGGVESSPLITLTAGAIAAGNRLSVHAYGSRLVLIQGAPSGRHGSSTAAGVGLSARKGQIERLDGGAAISNVTARPWIITEQLAGLGK